MRYLLSLAALVLLSGCATVEFTPYEGDREWKTSPGSFVDRKHGLPIYKGLPPRPYRVIGFIATTSGRGLGMETGDHAAVRAARKAGADAVVFLSREDKLAGVSGFSNWFPSGNAVVGTSYTAANYLDAGSYVAIKWR